MTEKLPDCLLELIHTSIPTYQAAEALLLGLAGKGPPSLPSQINNLADPS